MPVTEKRCGTCRWLVVRDDDKPKVWTCKWPWADRMPYWMMVSATFGAAIRKRSDGRRCNAWKPRHETLAERAERLLFEKTDNG